MIYFNKEISKKWFLATTLDIFSPSLRGRSDLSAWKPALMDCMRRRSLQFAICLLSLRSSSGVTLPFRFDRGPSIAADDEPLLTPFNANISPSFPVLPVELLSLAARNGDRSSVETLKK